VSDDDQFWRAVFAAKLPAGEMPSEIEEASAACRLSLFRPPGTSSPAP
jgi:uncharacterized Zn finger protein